MNVKPIAAPGQLEHNQNSQLSQQRSATQARAVAIASGRAPEQSPVLNQNAISPEELGAIRTSPQGQESTSEVVESTEQPSAPVEEQKTETAADPLSSQYAILARREKALRAKQQQQDQSYKAREEALKAREAAVAAKDQEYQTGYIPKSQLQQKTLQTLLEAGVSYDDITSQLLNQQPADPRTEAHISRLEAKLAALEQANETSQAQQKTQQQAAYDQAVKQIKTDTKQLVFTDPNFEMIKATNSVNDVVELIEKTYAEDGILLSVEEAAQQVEDYLIEESLKLAKIEKFKKRLGAVAPTQVPKQVQTPAPQQKTQPQMKTLTNATSSSRQLSAKERAILAFKGELKS